MSTLLDLYNLRYQSSSLKNRVTAALAVEAQHVLTEDAATPNHALRLVWAKSVLANTQQEAEKFIWAVLGQTDMYDKKEGASDEEVQKAVSGLVDTFAAETK
jgi:hypothetical protein